MARTKVISKQKAEEINDVILELALSSAIEGSAPLVDYGHVAEALGLSAFSAHAVGQVLAGAKSEIEYWYLVFDKNGTMVTPECLWATQLHLYREFCANLGIAA